MFHNICVLLLCVLAAECRKEAYEYVPSVGLYLKPHIFAATWPEARLTCHLEGGFLASPDNVNMLAAMIKISEDKLFRSSIYTGIHATYAHGAYTTITGTPLSDFDVEWERGEPSSDDDEECLVMSSSGELADKKCTQKYPFICYKSPEQAKVHSCSHSQGSSDYVLSNETGSCYKLHMERRRWSVAFRTCQAEEAYLAIINSKEESNVIKDLLSRNRYDSFGGLFSIGFTRLNENQEWLTINGQSLTEAGYAVFRIAEPSNFYSNAECGTVNRDGFLNDETCNSMLGFICEKPIEPEINASNF